MQDARENQAAETEAEVEIEEPGTDPELEPTPTDVAEARIAELEAERDEMRNRWMRAIADAENARKRSDRDRKEAEQYSGSKLSRDLLPVYDNMKRAVDTISEDQRAANAALIEGIELTQRELISVFAKHGIEPLSPAVGDRFDPQHHEAMFEAPVPNTRAGDIIQVMAEGFMLHDRLLRPAQVGVSSTPAQTAAPEPDPSEGT